MPVNPTYPGVYIEEVPSAVRTITGVPTSVTAFVGPASRGPVDEARHITSWADFERIYGGLSAKSPMSYAVNHFYLNGGSDAEIVRVAKGASPATIDLGSDVKLEARHAGGWGKGLKVTVDHATKDPSNAKLYNLTVLDGGTGAQERFLNVEADPASARSLDKALATSALVTPAKDAKLDVRPAAKTVDAAGGADGDVPGEADYLGSPANKTGLFALLATDIFNLLVVPPPQRDADPSSGVLAAAAKLCVDRRAVLLVDAPSKWTDVTTAVAGAATPPVSGDEAKNAAVYFPRLLAPDPLSEGAVSTFPAAGAIAGVLARTDAQRGVWKAPAGTDASISGAAGLTVKLTDLENGRLNPLGVNCLRSFNVIGTVVWGARTLRGADALADQWKYLPVRRLALFIEESLYRGTQWVVFEPNDEPLWSSIRLNVGAFMNSLFRQGAFQGRTPREAYLVKCDAETTTQNDIDRGIVNILVGFAPLKPAEFVIIRIQQLAGQLQT
jgi:Bacteriophage tail sheath protein